MRRNAGSAKEKNPRDAFPVGELLPTSRGLRVTAVGLTPAGKPENDWPESRSVGCGRNLWVARAERNDARTPSPSESSDLACHRERNPSSGKSRALVQRPTGGDWKWP